MPTDRRALLALSGAILASVSGCLGSDPTRADGDDEYTGPDPSTSELRGDPDVDTDDLDALVAGNTAFAFDLYDQLVTDEPAADHFVSPVSISMALAMTWAGARGETQEAMADALNFSLGQDLLHPAFNALDRALEAREASGNDSDDEDGDPFELNVANALWPNERITLRDEYVDTMGTHYGAQPVALDYSDPEQASEIINSWVADKTDGRIDDLVAEQHLAHNPSLVLTNAIYFLAGWLKSFDTDDTSSAEFTALDGSTGEVSMMAQTESFPYAAVDGHQLIELPYVGEETSMVVILPAAGEFESFEQELDADRLGRLLAELDSTRGTIELPRFELETKYTLNEMLSALGMGIAFTPDADFSGMGDGGTRIDAVLHDAFVAVDEEGTEAAGATAVVTDGSAPPPTEFEMVADRPFLFLIRDRPTDAVLFLGRVADLPDAPE